MADDDAVADDDALDDYRRKRDFTRTTEPEGGSTSGGDPTFVVQKHAARRLHYDVRVEVDGVMPSWAVPKGPSYDPAVKRLAVHVEDHPLDYQTFEGTIPAGEYGGGAVIVWDRGTYRNITRHRDRDVPMREAIERGHVSVWFDGEKLRGGWSFTRTSTDGREGATGAGKESWIMVKRKDEAADPDRDVTAAEPGSVRTGRTVEQVGGEAEPTWTRGTATWRPPMLAELTAANPEGPGWVYERKLDGLRVVAVRNDDRVDLWSRNHLSFNKRFPTLVEALLAQPVDNIVLDGEIVAMSGDRDSFARLQQRGSDATPELHVFDLLHLLGRDTTALSLHERKALLTEAVDETDVLRVVRHIQGDPGTLLERACRDGWEGLIAKRADGPYRSGRSGDWRKLKCSASQELVIGGWTEPRRTRTGFGALLVGVYDDTGLRYAGKVGTGFSTTTLTSLHEELLARESDSSPFIDTVRERTAHWARPDLVANVAFSEWTADGKLRHPRFEGLRPDKAPRQVRREVPPGR